MQINLSWIGHVARMDDDSLSNDIIYTLIFWKGLETEVASNKIQRCSEAKREEEYY